MLKKRSNIVILVITALFLAITLIVIKEQPVVHSLPVLVETRVHSHGETYVSLSQIPKTLQQAIIDTEDRNFYYNPGISLEGTGRSLVTDLMNGKYSEGGSTITQQLARQLFLTNKKTITRKLKEMFLAVMITANFSKQDILDMYLNNIYFGNGAWGIDSAARVYFNKPLDELDIAQATMLAGLPQSPSNLDPYKSYQAVRSRQWEVLQAMIKAGHIDSKRASEIYNMPLALRTNK